MSRYTSQRHRTTDYLAGSDVLRLLTSASGAVQAQRGECSQQLDRLQSEAEEDVERRGEQLLKLAKLYLPSVDRDTIAGTFREVRADLQAVLRRKQTRERDLQASWDRGLDTRQALHRELDEVTAELNDLVDRREQLEGRLAEVLEGDEAFAELSRQALRAEQELERNLERVEESKAEAAEKLPAYERSRLFQYLVKRKYGTPDYKKRGLTRRLDRWVARVVNFDKARDSYDFLRVTPELMAAEVERRRDEFDRLMGEVEAIEQRHSEAIGLTEVLKEGMKAGRRRDAVLTKIESEQAELDAIEAELESLAGGDNEFRQQAVDRMRRFLAGLNESALEAKTRGTAGADDDAIFEEIRWLNERVEASKRSVDDLRRQTRSLQRQKNDLSDLARRFQIAEYDSRRSVFPAGYDPRPEIEQFLRGANSKEAIWQSIKRQQQFLPTWVEQQSPSRDLLDSEFSYLMVRVLAEAAGVAIRHYADSHRRSRRGKRAGGKVSLPPSVRRRARGGFTGGLGF